MRAAASFVGYPAPLSATVIACQAQIFCSVVSLHPSKEEMFIRCGSLKSICKLATKNLCNVLIMTGFSRFEILQIRKLINSR